MLWLAETMCVFHKLLGLAACDVAEVALRHVPKDARLPAAALKVRRSHLHGKKSHKHVTAAMRANQIALDRLTYFYARSGVRSALRAVIPAVSDNPWHMPAATAAGWVVDAAGQQARPAIHLAGIYVHRRIAMAEAAEEKVLADIVRKRIPAAVMVKACGL